MNFKNVVINVLRGFLPSGRTSRAHYWLFLLGLVATLGVELWLELTFTALNGAVLVPTLLLGVLLVIAATIRRLRDAGRSPWNLLLLLAGPLAAAIPWMCTERAAGDFDRSRSRIEMHLDRAATLIATLIRILGQRFAQRLRRRRRRRSYGRRRGGGLEFFELIPIHMTASISHRAIILVHGTFARGATWVRDSDFSRALHQKSGGVATFAFIWSGANSHHARLNAGKALAEEIATLRQRGCKEVFLVAHSHGGNVTLYALRDPRANETVAGIVFLGTPFIMAEPRETKMLASVISQVVSWLVIFPILPFGLFFFVLLFGWLFEGVGILLTLLVLGPALLVSYLKWRSTFRHWIENVLIRRWTARQRFLGRWLHQRIPRCPTLTAIVAYDEASLWLRIIDTLASAPWLAVGLAARAIGAMTIAYLAATFGMMFIDDTLVELEGGIIPLIILTTAVLLALGPILLAFWVGMVRGYGGFGAEGLLGGVSTRIMASSLPRWAGARGNELVTVNRPAGQLGLRHSTFYSQPELAGTIGGWIRASAMTGTAHSGPAIVRTHDEGTRNTTPIGVATWLVPAGAAVAVVLAVAMLAFRAVEAGNQPKVDVSPAPFEAPPSALVHRWTIDGSYEKVDGFLNVAGARRQSMDLEIAPGQTCEFRGNFRLGNWGTSVALYFYTSRTLRPNETPADHANVRRVGARWMRDEIHTSVWHWTSSDGKAVSFRRVVRNPAHQSRVMFSVRNNSRTPSRVRGRVEAICG